MSSKIITPLNPFQCQAGAAPWATMRVKELQNSSNASHILRERCMIRPREIVL